MEKLCRQDLRGHVPLPYSLLSPYFLLDHTLPSLEQREESWLTFPYTAYLTLLTSTLPSTLCFTHPLHSYPKLISLLVPFAHSIFITLSLSAHPLPSTTFCLNFLKLYSHHIFLTLLTASLFLTSFLDKMLLQLLSSLLFLSFPNKLYTTVAVIFLTLFNIFRTRTNPAFTTQHFSSPHPAYSNLSLIISRYILHFTFTHLLLSQLFRRVVHT